MKRFGFLLILLLASCNTTLPLQDTVQTQVGLAQSAVVNLNIMNRVATIEPLANDSELLFSAFVADINSVTYSADVSEQAFIILGDNPNLALISDWAIQANSDIPMAYVVDVTDGSLSANLSIVNLPRFDIVASNSTIEIDFPSSAFQLASDVNNSTVNFFIPTGAIVQSSQLVSNGGLMTLDIANGVSFTGNVTIQSGGFTLTVPATTGVQIVVIGNDNSEISLPNASRTPAELTIYSTDNFEQAESQIILRADLNGAAIRIIQE